MKADGPRYYQEFTIDLKGTIKNPKDFYLTINTDAEEVSFLSFKVPVAYTKKTILMMTNGGALLSNPNFVRLISDSNFGVTKETAPVKSEGINFLESSSDNLDAEIQSKKPDIIIIGSGYPISENKARILKDFMTIRNDYGGYNPVIYMSSDPSVHYILTQLDLLTSEYKNTPTRAIEKTHDPKHTFEAAVRNNPLYRQRYSLPAQDIDFIANGSFKNIGGLSFQQTEGSMCVLNEALVYNRVMQYTGNLPFGINSKTNRKDFATSFFRDIENPFIYIGEGELIKISNWNFDAQSVIINTPNERPAKPVFDKAKDPLFLINNSLVFANIIEWALFTVEYGNLLER